MVNIAGTALFRPRRRAPGRSLRQVAAALAALSHLGPGSRPYGPGSVAAMLQGAGQGRPRPSPWSPRQERRCADLTVSYRPRPDR
jgi:hypothetical protein